MGEGNAAGLIEYIPLDGQAFVQLRLGAVQGGKARSVYRREDGHGHGMTDWG